MPQSFSKIYKRCCKYLAEKDLSSPNEVLSTVNVDFEGRQVKSSKYTIDNPRERYKGMQPSDFALENQLAVGVPQRPVYCSLQRGEIESQIELANQLKVGENE